MKPMKDLSAVLDVVHQEEGSAQAVDLEAVLDTRPGDYLAAGDEPQRPSYFDFEDLNQPLLNHRTGKKCYLVLGVSGEPELRPTLHDYRTPQGKRTSRMMMTVPPKLKEQLRELHGTEHDSEAPISVSIVALASYAAQLLIEEKRGVVVKAWLDPRKAQRSQLRQALKRRNRRN
ncbi:hypothetical protein [Stenotrophomonas bentonitica]